MWSTPRRSSELRGELDIVSAAGDPAADQDLVVARAVLVRGVEKCDTDIEGVADGGDDCVPVGFAVVLTHPHAAQALSRHSDPAESRPLHAGETTVMTGARSV